MTVSTFLLIRYSVISKENVQFINKYDSQYIFVNQNDIIGWYFNFVNFDT